MKLFLFYVILVLGNTGNTLRLPSTQKMLQSLEQRLDAKISNLEEQIKLENKQLREEISLIFENLIDFEDKMKLLLTGQNKDEDQDVGRIDDKSDGDFRNEDRFKQVDARMDDLETVVKREKEIKEEVVETMRTVSTAMSLMSDDIGEIRDNLEAMKEIATGDIVHRLESMNETINIGIKADLDSAKEAVSNEIRDSLKSLKETITGDIKDGLDSLKETASENRQNIEEINISLKSIIQNMEEAQNRCKIREDLERSRNTKLDRDLEDVRSLLNDTINSCSMAANNEEPTTAVADSATTKHEKQTTPIYTMKTKVSQTTVSTSAATKETTPSPAVYSSCNGVPSSGVYKIKLREIPTFDAYCDMDTDGGGWLVFQRRRDGSEDFYRNWDDYKRGFGNVSGEFWLGNEIIHKVTSSSPQELRVDLLDWNGSTAYANYGTFTLSFEADQYRLHVGGYSGTAGDCINSPVPINNQAFSTKDRDNDSCGTNCAVNFKGAWWYRCCTRSNLNGPYPSKAYSESTNIYHGLSWYTWGNRRYYSLKGSEMKMRPK